MCAAILRGVPCLLYYKRYLFILSVGCAVCHRLTGQSAVVVAHGDIPSHSSEAKRHHRSFSMRLETASSTSSNTSLLRAAKGHREGAAGGLDDTTTTDTAEPLPSNRARRVESLVDGVQEVRDLACTFPGGGGLSVGRSRRSVWNMQEGF